MMEIGSSSAVAAATAYTAGFKGLVLFHFPPVAAESVLPRAHRRQVEAGVKPAEVDVLREVDAHATVAKFLPTPSVHAIAYFAFM